MKLNFSIRKEAKVVFALLSIFTLIAFSERERVGTVCRDIVVELENVNENHFLDETDVMKLVESGGMKIKGIALERVRLKEIEKRIEKDKHILNAELFSDLKGDLLVNVSLRRPIARIVQEDAPDAYIAEDGVVMSVSEKYTSRVILISGTYVKRFLEDEDLNKTEEGQQIMKMIEFIRSDDFWRAQIAQMDINSAGKITLYPQITGQRVEFGRAENVEVKFKKLMIFYKEILPQRGWTKYERVNLEYEGQVIAE